LRFDVAAVDDEAPVRTALRRLLRSADSTVAEFASGEEFLASLDVQRLGCVTPSRVCTATLRHRADGNRAMARQPSGVRLAGWILVAVVGGAAVLWLGLPTSNRQDDSLVRDDAGLMSVAQRDQVARYHQHLLDDFDIDFRVVTGRGLDDVNRVAVERFRAIGENSRSRSGRALLLLIDATSNQARLEVGYQLEGSFPDVFVGYVERRQMVPFFEVDRVADGILATTELIVTQAQQSANAMDVALEAWVASSGGGGAVTAARLGAGPQQVDVATDDVPPGRTPEATLHAYFQAMGAHNANPGLAIYTPETREMLARWLTTPAQMDNVVRTYGRCQPGQLIVSAEGNRAVIRYRISETACAPFFFQRRSGQWQLDLTMMQRAIRFDAGNAWRFVARVSPPYGFAFADWQFDARGYPRADR
jgi:uncharacterized protein